MAGQPNHPATRRQRRRAGSRLWTAAFGASAAALVCLTLAPGSAAAQRRAPSAPSAVDWSTYGYDLQRTGYNPDESQLGVANAADLHQSWAVDLGAVMIAQPVEANRP